MPGLGRMLAGRAPLYLATHRRDQQEHMTLEELRRQLDELDTQLLLLVAARQAASREVARVKRATGRPTRDYAREREVILAAREAASPLGVSPDTAEAMMRLLIRS